LQAHFAQPVSNKRTRRTKTAAGVTVWRPRWRHVGGPPAWCWWWA